MLFISLGPDFKDTHEQIVTCIAYLVSYSEIITSNLWTLYPNIVELFLHTCSNTQAYYILDPLVVAMSNFIQKGGDVFLNVKMQNGKTPIENIFQLISDIFNFSKLKTENLAVYGFQLLIAILENHRGSIDHFFEAIINVIASQVQEIHIPQNRFIHIQTISCLFMYDAKLALQIMDKMNFTTGFIELWFT